MKNDVVEMNLKESYKWLSSLDNDYLSSLNNWFTDDRDKLVKKILRERKIIKLNERNNNDK